MALRKFAKYEWNHLRIKFPTQTTTIITKQQQQKYKQNGEGETKAALERILMNSAPACPFGMLNWQGEKLWCLLLVILLVKSQVHKSYPVGFILFKGYSMYLAHPGQEADSAGPCSLVLFGDGLGFGRVIKMYCHHW